MLVNFMGYSFNDFWLRVSISLYLFSGVLWLVAVYLQVRMRDMAFVAQKEKKDLDEEYFRLQKYWIWLEVLAFVAMIMVLYLMIYKCV